MLEANGEPRNIRGIDTWWSRNPGEKLAFQDATLIVPNGEQEEIFITDGSEVRYKTANYEETDLDEIASNLGEEVRDEIKELLDEEGVSIKDESVQQKIANIIKNALVHREITEVRGKEYLRPDSPAHYMPTPVQNRIGRMVAELGLGSRCSLHMDSVEGMTEEHSINEERVYDIDIDDPKTRRVVYASGLMVAGGLARKAAQPIEYSGPTI